MTDRAEPVIRLRKMTGADAGDSLPLLSQLGCEMSREEAATRVRDVAAAAGHALFVAEGDGQLVGLLHVFVRPAIENPREAVVQALVVGEKWRRQGVGRMLMTAAECWGSEHECRSVVLDSSIARAPAHAFYQSLGYRVAATAYVLRKPLAPPR